MINTLSLCPTCYRKISASIFFKDGAAWMIKECPVHGKTMAMVERDSQFLTSFYREGTLGNNNHVIVHSYDKCNLNCSWCYYPCGKEKILDPFQVNDLLGMYRSYGIMLSGGEPTIDPLFFDKLNAYDRLGWRLSCITNMTMLADKEFTAKALDSPLHQGEYLNFACSFQHPKNHSDKVNNDKFMALHNMEVVGVKPSCIMFSIQSLDELVYIKDFYDRTKGLYPAIRIRTMFRNWNAKGINREIFLSDLYKEFNKVFEQYAPTQSLEYEHSNMYCLYMKMEGCQVSLSSSPSVEDIDYNQCSRPVFMLAMDHRCYPVPITQIINEGISNGWKDGFQLVKEA